MRATVSLAVLLTMLVPAGCGRKAMPEPRQSALVHDHGNISGGMEAGREKHLPVKAERDGGRNVAREGVSRVDIGASDSVAVLSI